MPVADLAQALQVADRRHQDAGRARHRLDDQRGDVGSVVQADEALEVFRQLAAPARLAAAEGHVRQAVGVADMVDAGQQHGAEDLAVGRDAAHRHAAEVHAVIAALATDQPGAMAIATRAVVGQRDLQCGVGRLRPGVGEEHPIQPRRRQLRNLAGEGNGAVIGDLETHAVVERGNLLLHRRDDGRMAVAQTRGPQAGEGIQQLLAVLGGVVVAAGGLDDAWRFPEGAVGRVRQPEGLIVIHCRHP